MVSSSVIIVGKEEYLVLIEIATNELNYRMTHQLNYYPEIEGYLEREVGEIELLLWTKLVRRLVALYKIDNGIK